MGYRHRANIKLLLALFIVHVLMSPRGKRHVRSIRSPVQHVPPPSMPDGIAAHSMSSQSSRWRGQRLIWACLLYSFICSIALKCPTLIVPKLRLTFRFWFLRLLFTAGPMSFNLSLALSFDVALLNSLLAFCFHSPGMTQATRNSVSVAALNFYDVYFTF